MTQVNYSFSNVKAAISGPNGAFSMGYGTGIDDGGITVELTDARVEVKTGADGTPMWTLYCSQRGKVMVRVMKNSPLNAQLSALYAADTSDPTQVGQNTIAVSDTSLMDLCTASSAGIEKHPSSTYGKDGPMLEWTFLAGKVTMIMGGGGASASAI